MIFKKIVEDVIDLCAQDEGGDFEVMAKAAINRIYRRLLRIADNETEKREFSFSTVADQSQYGLPLDVQNVLNIEDTANKKRIYDISWRDFDDMYPGDTTTGDPDKAYPVGEFGVQAQPDAASTIEVVSDSTADTGNHKLRITGYDNSDYLISELLTVTGTTTATSTKSFKKIERLTKSLTSDSATWAGTLTITDTTESDTLSVIPPEWESPSYQWYEFQPIPDAVYTYVIRAIARKPPLVNDEDWPSLAEDYHSLLFLGAAMELLPSVGKDEMARSVRRDFEIGMEEMKGGRDNRPNMIRVFSDVSSFPQMPQRPWIAGVDY